MSFDNSRFRVAKLFLMALALPTALFGWGQSKVLGWQNPSVQSKKASIRGKDNSFSPELSQNLKFPNVGKVPNLLLSESIINANHSLTENKPITLPNLRKSVTDELPQLLSQSAGIAKFPKFPINGTYDSYVSLVQNFEATAYSIKGITACGARVRSGIVAADPKILPLGSIVKIQAGKYSGLYRVMDTGPAIRGNRLDIYMACRKEAKIFGRRKIHVEVVRYGWGDGNKLEEIAQGQ